MKILPHLIVGLCFASLQCFAGNKNPSDDYFSNSYEESKVTLKIKSALLLPVEGKEQQQGLPTPTTASALLTPQAISPLLYYGGGLEAGATVFLTGHLASELSLGVQMYQANSAALKDVGYNYSTNPQYTDVLNVYSFPVTATAQLHLAPYGGVRPYIGGGIVGALFYSASQDFKIERSMGGVIQGGLELYFRDESTVGIEIKKYVAFNPVVRYQASMLGQEVSGKLGLNPWVISLNMGLTF